MHYLLFGLYVLAIIKSSNKPKREWEKQKLEEQKNEEGYEVRVKEGFFTY